MAYLTLGRGDLAHGRGAQFLIPGQTRDIDDSETDDWQNDTVAREHRGHNRVCDMFLCRPAHKVTHRTAILIRSTEASVSGTYQ